MKTLSTADRLLIDAASDGDTEAIVHALEEGANIEAQAYWFDCQTPLLIAANHGHVKCFVKLLKEGASIDACNKYGSSALELAANSFNINNEGIPVLPAEALEIMQICLTNIPEGPDRQKAAQEALPLAACTGEANRIKLLLDAGADTNARYWESGDTILIDRAKLGAVSTCRKLLDLGADINTTNKGGYTALMIVASKGNEELVRLLLRYEPDISVKNRNGKTAIDLAQENGHYVIVQLLK